MIKYLITSSSLLLAVGAMPAAAVTLDLSILGNGNIGTTPLSYTGVDNTVTISAINANSRGLRATQGINALFGGVGLCADGAPAGILTPLGNCKGTINFAFSNPVSEFSLRQTGVSILGSTAITVLDSTGITSTSINSLLSLSLLNIIDNVIIFSGFDQIQSVSINNSSALDTGLYYGSISYTTFVEEVPAAIPVPAALPLLGLGLGALGVVARKRKRERKRAA